MEAAIESGELLAQIAVAELAASWKKRWEEAMKDDVTHPMSKPLPCCRCEKRSYDGILTQF